MAITTKSHFIKSQCSNKTAGNILFSELFLDNEKDEAVRDVELGDDEVEGVAGEPGGGQTQDEAEARALVTRQPRHGGACPHCLGDPVLRLGGLSPVTPGEAGGQDEEQEWTLVTTLERSST